MSKKVFSKKIRFLRDDNQMFLSFVITRTFESDTFNVLLVMSLKKVDWGFDLVVKMQNKGSHNNLSSTCDW